MRDLTDERFGRLAVVRATETDKYGNAQWICNCDCGRTIKVRRQSLTSGATQSCGCLRKEKSSERLSARNRLAVKCSECGGNANLKHQEVVNGIPERSYNCAHCERDWKTMEVEAEVVSLMADALTRGQLVR